MAEILGCVLMYSLGAAVNFLKRGEPVFSGRAVLVNGTAKLGLVAGIIAGLILLLVGLATGSALGVAIWVALCVGILFYSDGR